MKERIKELIVSVLENIDYERIVLFGSRARGDYTEKSDYDILIIMKDDVTIKEKMLLSSLLRKRLAKIGMDMDIIIKTRAEIEYYEDKIGSVVKNALKEGVPL